MDKLFEKTDHQRRCTLLEETHKNISNIINYQGDSSYNYNEL